MPFLTVILIFLPDLATFAAGWHWQSQRGLVRVAHHGLSIGKSFSPDWAALALAGYYSFVSKMLLHSQLGPGWQSLGPIWRYFFAYDQMSFP